MWYMGMLPIFPTILCTMDILNCSPFIYLCFLFFLKKSDKQCQDEAPKEFLNAEKLSTYHTYNEFKKTFTHLLTAMSFQTCVTFFLVSKNFVLIK